MAIQVTNAQTQPALVYDQFFLERLELTQRASKLHSDQPYYVLKVHYRMFAVDGSDERHYENRVSTFEIDDYFTVAMGKAASGDMDLVNAAGAIEIALAKIIEDIKPELGTVSVI